MYSVLVCQDKLLSVMKGMGKQWTSRLRAVILLCRGTPGKM